MTVHDLCEKVRAVNATGKYKADWNSLCAHPAPQWFRRSKFGIFIHWGVFSVPAAFSEWYPRHMYREGSPEHEDFRRRFGDMKHFGYKDLIPMFTAPNFDAEAWMRLFREAGARYVTPVAEHHDGFQMYRSELSRWNSAEMGPKRDVLGELKAAAEREGLILCASSHRAEHYWFMNGGRTFDSDVNDPAYDDFYGPAIYNDDLKDPGPKNMYSVGIRSPRMREHLDNWLARCAELIDNYRPAMLYFDWWIANEAFRPYLKELAAYYYNRAEEWGTEVTICYKHNTFPLDAATFDVERGQLSGIRMRPWQTDTAIAVNSWCYTKNNIFKRAQDIVADLIDIVSKNGNLMLNVGPRANGTICEEEATVLRAVGEWMRVNGEAIYDTLPWKVFGEGPTKIADGQFTDTARGAFTAQDIRYTCKGDALYIFVLHAADGIREIALRALAEGEQQAGEAVLAESAVVLGDPDNAVTILPGKDAMRLTLARPVVSEYPVCIRLKVK